jgi:hypothetical protein
LIDHGDVLVKESMIGDQHSNLIDKRLPENLAVKYLHEVLLSLQEQLLELHFLLMHKRNQKKLSKKCKMRL